MISMSFAIIFLYFSLINYYFHICAAEELVERQAKDVLQNGFGRAHGVQPFVSIAGVDSHRHRLRRQLVRGRAAVARLRMNGQVVVLVVVGVERRRRWRKQRRRIAARRWR